MNDVFTLADDLGPVKVIHVHEPGIGLQGVLVVDNVARGPSVGRRAEIGRKAVVANQMVPSLVNATEVPISAIRSGTIKYQQPAG